MLGPYSIHLNPNKAMIKNNDKIIYGLDKVLSVGYKT